MDEATHLHCLSEKVEQYSDWKHTVARDIKAYRNWLIQHGLGSEDIIKRLNASVHSLSTDQLSIAFVGEFSRGKTELINALLFADFNRRILPSQAGRTTMCPTALFFEKTDPRNYIRLLPIETRKSDVAMVDLVKRGEQWSEFAIDTSQPEQMNLLLQYVAETKSVSSEEAQSLGFEQDMLDADETCEGYYFVPKWRHAEISLDSPLLRQGLRILDTPGLNALGSEPELSIGMIPKAHAVLYMLSADTGVTASDMTSWHNYVNVEGADHRAGRFAVLNKVDILWDDLQGDTYSVANIERMRRDTAKKLNMSLEDVLPLSAKQAMHAQAKHDDDLLRKSALPKLEALISERLLKHKEGLINEMFLDDVMSLLMSSEKVLTHRLRKLKTECLQLGENVVDSEALKALANKTQQDQERYHKKLVALKSSHRLTESQGEILKELVSLNDFKALENKTRTQLEHAWSTFAMSNLMANFFVQLEQQLDALYLETKMADKMVEMIYKRFRAEESVDHLSAKPFDMHKQRKQLNDLNRQLKRFRRHPKTLITEQTILIKRFFTTFVAEARLLIEAVYDEANRWSDGALMPIMQFTREQKKTLEKQTLELKEMAGVCRDQREQREALQALMHKLQEQRNKASAIRQHLAQMPQLAANFTG
jgi:hypothetical protein